MPIAAVGVRRVVHGTSMLGQVSAPRGKCCCPLKGVCKFLPSIYTSGLLVIFCLHHSKSSLGHQGRAAVSHPCPDLPVEFSPNWGLSLHQRHTTQEPQKQGSAWSGSPRDFPGIPVRHLHWYFSFSCVLSLAARIGIYMGYRVHSSRNNQKDCPYGYGTGPGRVELVHPVHLPPCASCLWSGFSFWGLREKGRLNKLSEPQVKGPEFKSGECSASPGQIVLQGWQAAGCW